MYALNVSANVQWTIVSLHAVSYVRVVCPCVLCMQLHSLTSEPCFTLKKNMAGSLGQHSHFLLDLGVSINQICKKKSISTTFIWLGLGWVRAGINETCRYLAN